MAIPRIFVAAELESKRETILDISSSIRLLQVLRLKINDSLIVFGNSNIEGEYTAVITAINKNRAVIFIKDFVQCSRESPLQIHLCQGISRGEKMDFTVQKAVELGVNTITPLFTEYCNVKLEGERLVNRMRHWQEIAISAAEQSGRCCITKVLPAQTLKNGIAKATATGLCNGLCLVLDPCAVNKLSSIKECPSSITILVGPEGGLSDKEIAFVRQSQFLSIKLGPRILRTETAALVAISALQSQCGDF